MDLFELSAVLGLDTTKFKNGLDAAKLMVDGFVSLVGKAFDATVDFLGESIETGLEFEKVMAGVYSVSGAYEQASQDMLNAAVLAEAAGSSFTASEVGMAAYYEALAGYDLNEIVDGLHGVVVAAEASGESLDKVTDIITDTTRAYGDAVGEQTHYADVFAAAATNSNTTIIQMGNAMKYVSPLAAALGYKFDDVAVTYMLMADNGTKATMAGTALRNIMSRLATNAGQTNKDLGALDIVTQKLGVSFYDSEGKARPWLEFITDARKSWRGMSDEMKNEVAAALSDFMAEMDDGSEGLQQFAEDAKNVTSIIGQMASTKDAEQIKKYNEELKTYAQTYKGLFDMLGIEVDTSNINAIGDAFDQARIKLNGLSDQEAIYFSKQIASLRGMPGWLEIMNATDEAFDKAQKSIKECTGAAEKMRDVRLGSNLYGDITRINSKLDVLKNLIFFEMEGPLRDLAQFVMGALDNITDAISEDGLIGGIRQLGKELDRFREEYKDKIKEWVESIVPIVTTIVDTLAPAFTGAAIIIGRAFADGILDGIYDRFIESDNPILKKIGSALHSPVKIPISPELDLNSIQEALDEAREKGQLIVALEGYGAISTDYTAEEIYEALKEGGHLGAQAMSDSVTSAMTDASKQVSNTISTDLSTAGNTGGEDMIGNVVEKVVAGTDGIRATMTKLLGESGTDGGANMSENVRNELSNRVDELRGLLTKTFVDSGVTGGDEMMQKVYEALNAELTEIGTSLSSTIGNAGKDGGEEMSQHVLAENDAVSKMLEITYARDLAKSGKTGGAEMAGNVYTESKDASALIEALMEHDLADAGKIGGTDMAQNTYTALDNKTSEITQTMTDALSDSGITAGNSIAADVQSQLNANRFFVHVQGIIDSVIDTVSGIFNFNASAMSEGRIYNNATVFGYANKAFQVAGDAGPEAVVGVHSLRGMIMDAVRQATAGQEIIVPQNTGRDITIILELDGQQFGKAVYRANKDETQRVGTRVVMGGVY